MFPALGSLAFDSLGGAGGLANNGMSSNTTGDKFNTLNFGNSADSVKTGITTAHVIAVGIVAGVVFGGFSLAARGRK